MSDITIRVDHCILSRVEGLSKLYHLGRAQQRHDTTSTPLRAAPLWGSASLRDALAGALPRTLALARSAGVPRKPKNNSSNSSNTCRRSAHRWCGGQCQGSWQTGYDK
jgi:hypothetical protein